jgi:iron-sulfur cluster repair protein YtfE (RIC family)
MLKKARPTLEHVKDCIRADHAEIRNRLAALEILAVTEDLNDSSSHSRKLTDAVWSLFLAFDQHLGTEEVELFPYVEQLEGAERLSRLREEHAQQRTVLLAMVNDCDAKTMLRKDRAEDVSWFANSLRRDMTSEERELDALSDVGYVVDQCTGSGEGRRGAPA